MPNGELTSEQLRFLGDCIAPYGKDGCADITTRANIQARRSLILMSRLGRAQEAALAAAPLQRLAASVPMLAMPCSPWPLQLRGVTLEDADTIIAGLQQRGLTSFMVGTARTAAPAPGCRLRGA